jgi:hypothetical protein
MSGASADVKGRPARLDSVRELTRDHVCALVAVLGCGARIPISRRRSAAFTAVARQLGGNCQSRFHTCVAEFSSVASQRNDHERQRVSRADAEGQTVRQT